MLLVLLALAVVDSVNPSAILVTLFLLARGRAPSQVFVYIATIFLTYLTLGVLMVSGLDALLPSLHGMGSSRVGLIIQGIVGLVMLGYALKAPPTATAAPPIEPGASSYVALALLGATVTTMELPTAVPYVGAVALLTSADLPMTEWLPLLVLYNVIFVLPPLLLVAGHVAFGKRMEARYASLRDRLQAGAREAMLWIFGFVGGALLLTSAIEYVARYAIR